jgi:ketosteroid isomerase-like protein
MNADVTATDRVEIEQVLIRYGNAVDDLAFDRLTDVFTPDVRATYGGGPWLTGLEEIFGHIGGLRNFAASLHLFGNMEIDVDGDRARSTSRALTHLIERDGTVHVRALRYRDQLVRTPAGWRISERIHTAQFAYDASAEVFEANPLPTA